MRRESLLLTSILVIVLGISIAAAIPPATAATTLFKVTIIAPGNANMVRRQWGQIIANSLQDLGIDARLVFMGWSAVFDRSLYPPVPLLGKTYDEGGWDLTLVGYTPGLIATPRSQFLGDSAVFAPFGDNYYLYNSTKSNELLNTYVTTPDPALREKALKDWQSLAFNDNPVSMLLYETNVVIVNPALSNYDWIYFNVQPSPAWLKKSSGTTNTAIYASTGEIESLNPVISNSWYDTIIFNPMFNGLTEVNNAKEFIPSLVESYSSTSDGHTWTLNLRQNVKWHTGWTFSADDVVFTLMSAMNTQVGSKKVGYYTGVFGDYVKLRWVNGTDTYLYYNATSTQTQFNPDPASVPSATRAGNITAVDANTIQLYLPNIKGLDKPYGFFEIDTLSYANNIMPKHVLEKVAPADWTTCPFNTGQGSLGITLANGTAYTITGPVGTGPYEWVGFDATAQLVTMKKFDSYWNKTNLEAIGQFGIENYYVKFITDKVAALAALKNGEVDILDQNYQMTSDVPTIGSSWGKVFLIEGSGRQEMGFNMRHPILGTGTGTPLGTAEAARHVRLAIDYAIPRQLIIDNLLDGYGTPGATACLPTQLYYNTTITPRPYDLDKARQELKAAGYNVAAPPSTPTYPSFYQGMNFFVTGRLQNYTAGSSDVNMSATPAVDRLIQVRQTSDNQTFETIATTTTDSSGRYNLVVTPTKTGKSYYYLNFYALQPGDFVVEYGPQAIANGTLIRTLTVSTFSDTISAATTPLSNQITTLQNNMNDQIAGLRTQNNYLIIGIVIAIIIAIIAIFLGRRT